MEPRERDYYVDLGITQSASQGDIKKAYRRLAIIHHPDKKAPGQTIDAAEFRQIQTAYEFLSDTTKRALYNLRYARIQGRWTNYRKQQQAEEQKRAREEEEKRAAAAATNAATEKLEKARLMEEIWRRAEKEWRKAGPSPASPGADDQERQAQADRQAERTRAAFEARRKRAEERASRERAACEAAARAKVEDDAKQASAEEEARQAEEAGEAGRVAAEFEADFKRQQRASAAACPHTYIGTLHWLNDVVGCHFCNSQTLCYLCPACNIPACGGCRAKLAR